MVHNEVGEFRSTALVPVRVEGLDVWFIVKWGVRANNLLKTALVPVRVEGLDVWFIMKWFLAAST